MGGICPRGFYCPSGSVHPLPCTPGMACTRAGLSQPDAACQEGYYCRAQSSSATPRDDTLEGDGGNRCRPGFYCPAASAWPLACPIGTYNPDFLATSVSACRVCPARTYCGSLGLSAPSDYCPAGYFCVAGSTTPRPTSGLCPPGHFCILGSAAPSPCPTGTYQPSSGSTSCIACPAGFSCTSTTK
jgi:hypothetical protein